MHNIRYQWLALAVIAFGTNAAAAPRAQDRVYTADQNSNTVSVINPADNALLGQIKLGNPRPEVLSPLYKGELNVHGLGFSPDGKTLVVVSVGSNAVTFVDTATNRVKGTAYIGRSPHEAFFTPRGDEVWAVVRGESHISVIDPKTFEEKRRIPTSPGPGMVIFHPNGKFAYVCSSFTPVVEVVDVHAHRVVKKLAVASPFSPFLQLTPDGKEVWLTHKDIGKVTRIDALNPRILGNFDTGFITNHLGFAKTPAGAHAYVTIGGENAVKVFTVADKPELVATIPVGKLPHGIWPSGDFSRMYVGLENDDAVAVIDTATNRVIATVPVGQAPQALVYVANAAPDAKGPNLTPRPETPPAINVALKPQNNDGKGFVVVRTAGLLDTFEVSLFKLKPKTVYKIYRDDVATPLGIFKTNEKGMVNGSVIGPLRTLASSDAQAKAYRLLVMQGDAAPAADKATMVSEAR